MDKILLKKVIIDQKSEYLERLKGNIIARDLSKRLLMEKKGNHIVIVSGIRRCGKSTLLDVFRSKEKENDYFLNFDDERLADFQISDFQMLVEVFAELYGRQKTFYFDEIQNIKGWERFVRRLHNGQNKVYITGSNATMLSRELGTHLTGRYVGLELYPFSFREFLKFKKVEKIDIAKMGTVENAKIKKLFEEYLHFGGFPEYLKTKNKQRLKELYDNIIYRDIVVRHKIKGVRSLRDLTKFVASNFGKEISFRSLAKIVGLKNPTTVKEYFGFLEDSYLTFLLTRFDYSFKKQIQATKKSYFIDSALANVVGFHFSENSGRILENLVFLELKKQDREIFYFSEGKECDFVIQDGANVREVVQVSYDMYNKETRKREIGGLLEAMNKFKLKQGLILTNDEEEELSINKKKILILPVWKWLLIDNR